MHWVPVGSGLVGYFSSLQKLHPQQLHICTGVMSVVVDPQTPYLILLVLGGHVGMSLLLATNFLSSHVKRHIMFVNFCITWMIYTLANTLLSVTSLG
jgi:hypothetical protein